MAVDTTISLIFVMTSTAKIVMINYYFNFHSSIFTHLVSW